jgi:uncharacterized protein YkwD
MKAKLHNGFTVTDRGINYKITKLDIRNQWVYGDKTFEDVTIQFNMSKKAFEAFLAAIPDTTEQTTTKSEAVEPAKSLFPVETVFKMMDNSRWKVKTVTDDGVEITNLTTERDQFIDLIAFNSLVQNKQFLQ